MLKALYNKILDTQCVVKNNNNTTIKIVYREIN